jgi:integrase
MNTSPSSLFDPFLDALATLPELPRNIQYEDDYDEITRTINVSESDLQAPLYVSGSVLNVQFHRMNERVRPLLRTYLLTAIQSLSPNTVLARYHSFLRIAPCDLEELAMAKPMQARSIWNRMIPSYGPEELAALKVLLAFLCRINFVNWTPLHVDLVSHGLAGASRDVYATVRSGECFLSVHEEAHLIRWLDDLSSRASSLSLAELQEACLVTCSYQFGMRPKQLGMVRQQDLMVRVSPEDGSQTAHITFKMIKQRDESLSRLPLVRKVRREWAALFGALNNLKSGASPEAFLFGFTNRADISRTLTDVLGRIVPGARITAYDLRHTLAQRMVDAGASQEELAAAMGHSSLKTGLVYFQASANQAELVNKALGASEIYQAVIKIAERKFIDHDELASLRGDKQVGGVPHGIPISGIGGCSSGQSSCPYNPISACYGCPKFMPVRDMPLHEQVLKDFRSIVLFFKNGGHGDMNSPAYLQLQRTIAEVQAVIEELREVANA